MFPDRKVTRAGNACDTASRYIRTGGLSNYFFQVEAIVVKIRADFQKKKGRMPHFWGSMGSFPGILVLNPAMQQILTYVSSIPNGEMKYVRMHYLLELVKVRKMDTDSPEYDWSKLDEVLDVLMENNLKPFFEVMGNPSGYFINFIDDNMVYAWKRLVRDMALHYIERYGLDEVASWYFESWNEPDGTNWFEGTMQAYLNYYDACSEGLKEASGRLVFGGPGTSITLSNHFKTLLAHCDSGTNYFTKETGVRMDFISVHEKGAPPSLEDLTPDTKRICDHELQAINYIRQEHPRFQEKPFMNNECDPQIGWSDFHTWHARPYYAAIICKMINQHLISIMDDAKCNYRLLSNDNCFIARWGNRSLLACFGEELDMSYDGKEFLTRPDPMEKILKSGQFALIKKPAFNAMVLLSLLGNDRCETEIAGNVFDNPIGAIAARNGEDQITVLVYNSSDKIMNGGAEKVDLALQGIPFGEAAIVHYRIDEEHGDPYMIWERSGAPWLQKNEIWIPDEELLAEMRDHQELVRLNDVQEIRISDGKLDISFDLPLTGVNLIVISKKPEEAPAKVNHVKAKKYKGLIGNPEWMISWRSFDAKFIKTYEVLFADRPDGPYKRVNKQDLVCTAYLHTWDISIDKGYFKIRAVDYWGRAGEESDIVEV